MKRPIETLDNVLRVARGSAIRSLLVLRLPVLGFWIVCLGGKRHIVAIHPNSYLAMQYSDGKKETLSAAGILGPGQNMVLVGFSVLTKANHQEKRL